MIYLGRKEKQIIPATDSYIIPFYKDNMEIRQNEVFSFEEIENVRLSMLNLFTTLSRAYPNKIVEIEPLKINLVDSE